MRDFARKQGKIKPVKSKSIPRHLLFIDVETYEIELVKGVYVMPNKLGVAIYVELHPDATIRRRHVYRFEHIHEFIEIVQSLLNKKTKLHIFGHNVGFDIRALMLPEIFDLLQWESEPPVINERVFIWRVTPPEGSITFLDTANFGVESVSRLGNDLKFSKLEIDFNETDNESLYIYCERDVEIIEKFMIDYISFGRLNNLGGFKSTLAAQSMSAFRCRFMPLPPVIHINEEVLALERKAYHGGRVECHFLGQTMGSTYYYLDVNSMYPASMTQTPLPYHLLGHLKVSDIPKLANRMKHFYCIADVTIKTSIPAYPIKRDEKLVFPIGTFRTELHHAELAYALEHDHILEVHEVSTYQKGFMFDDYINFFYGVKERATIEGNLSWRLIAKLFLNSLYGKFGQLKPHRKKVDVIPYKGVYRRPCGSMTTGKTYQEICWYGVVYREDKEGETTLSCPSIAGGICATARMILFRFMEIAGFENVMYLDTDSLITNEEGYNNLLPYLHPTRLGALKLEKQGRYLAIYGNKDYVFSTERRTKGVPRKATRLDKDSWEYLQFQGFISYLNKGAVGYPVSFKRNKHRRHSYNKGIVQPNGRVTPLVLEDLPD